MQASPYLNFDGQCAEAFNFYAQRLGGNVVAMQTFGDSPMADQMPVEARDRILHARLVAGDAVVTGSDSLPGQYERSQGFSVALQLDDPAETDRIFHALEENGTVTMPVQQTFFARRFGMLVDRFGISWIINCE